MNLVFGKSVGPAFGLTQQVSNPIPRGGIIPVMGVIDKNCKHQASYTDRGFSEEDRRAPSMRS